MISRERLLELITEHTYYVRVDPIPFARAVEREAIEEYATHAALAARLAEAEARIESMRNDDWGSLRRRVEEAEALLFDVRETLANVENTSEVDLSDACWCGVYDRIDAFLGDKA